MATFKKITGLPAASSVLTTDLVEITHDPAGSPVSQKAPISSLLALSGSGIFTDTTGPNGVTTATGPAIFLGSGAIIGQMWAKVTAGTSNTDWFQLL